MCELEKYYCFSITGRIITLFTTAVVITVVPWYCSNFVIVTTVLAVGR